MTADRPATVRVLSSGLATSVQDYPGRRGYWAVGVPPSGPMDPLALRLGNRLLGNPETAAGLEWTAVGPTLQFEAETVVCLAGAASPAMIDRGAYAPFTVAKGETLKLERISGAGLRGYVLFRGGIDVPAYLGSRATFLLGGFGGYAGRNITAGDELTLGSEPQAPLERALPRALQPQIAREWTLRVLYGPHGAPDFFTEEDIGTFLSEEWRVHHHSNRTGVRLIGPRPRWARRNGGEAGLHPSNIHDNPYAIGAVDFTGDMPIILGPDGPSLGGFVCPFVTIQADLWKLGQLAPGDTLRFCCVSAEEARAAEHSQDALIEHLRRRPGHLGAPATDGVGSSAHRTPVLAVIESSASRPRAVYRRQGDRHVLIEYGPPVLDLELRLRVHALMEALGQLELPGVIDVTPGIRSLQVHHDARTLPQSRLLAVLKETDERLGALEHIEIPSRVIHLPLSFDDPAVKETITRYMASVRSDAPWCPDNIEFIRRVNGLDSAADVRRIVFEASYLVLGLGDVYLGAPVAVPLDPRHRLVTTKYNPARTWTPPNVVGIGGAYLCIYGLEGPGGYQLFGRTLQVWNDRPQAQPAFRDGKPWLLRFFDQIRFFPVEAAELAEWRREFPLGRCELRIEPSTFRLADYRRFLSEHAREIGAFQHRRQAAFDSECLEWERRNELPPPQMPRPLDHGMAIASLADVKRTSPLMNAALGPR